MPTLILDFDDTLYNTELLKKTHFAAVKPYLITKTEVFWKECAEKVITKHGYYIYKKHVAQGVSKEDYPKAVKAYEKAMSRGKEFIYPDTVDFLKKYSRQFDLVMLTFGHSSFQRDKIKLCRLDKYFKKIIITTGVKYKEIPKIKNKFSAPYIFIDDKGSEIDSMKKKYSEVTCYWMRRSNGKSRNKPCKLFDKKITNLKINL